MFEGSRAKEIAADIVKSARDQHDETFAASWDKLASTRRGWANRAKEIAAGIARRVAKVSAPALEMIELLLRGTATLRDRSMWN
jgi:hypothetical protein